MNNILENFEKDQIQQLLSEKTYPKFNSGDTLKVHLKVKEGEKERIQVFEGVCIAKKNAGLNSSFTVRKISDDFTLNLKLKKSTLLKFQTIFQSQKKQSEGKLMN